MAVTKEQMLAAIKTIEAIRDTIYDMGEQGCPSGPLYASLMATGMRLEHYQQVIAMLKEAGLIVERNNVLYKRED